MDLQKTSSPICKEQMPIFLEVLSELEDEITRTGRLANEINGRANKIKDCRESKSEPEVQEPVPDKPDIILIIRDNIRRLRRNNEVLADTNEGLTRLVG
jgi:hypothetical protein